MPRGRCTHGSTWCSPSILWLAGADLLLTVIALGPLARGQGWAYLAGAWPFVQASYFIAIAAIPQGRPPELYSHVVLAVVVAIYLAGLLVGRRARRSGSARWVGANATPG